MFLEALILVVARVSEDVYSLVQSGNGTLRNPSSKVAASGIPDSSAVISAPASLTTWNVCRNEESGTASGSRG